MKKQLQFNEWMLKIKNIHYSDMEKMDRAFQRLEENSEDVSLALC